MNIINTDKAPAAIGPYSQAIKTGNFVYTSGQTPINPISGQVETTDIVGQTEQVIKNLQAVLIASESSIEKVVKTTCYLKNIKDFTKFNEIYSKYFIGNPARSCIEVSALPNDFWVEIEAIALAE